jgi:hypothetical protein
MRVTTDVLADDTDQVHYVCLGRDHLELGKAVPKNEGHFTLHRLKWAYCSAGRAEEAHFWGFTGGVAISALDHEALPRLVRPEG